MPSYKKLYYKAFNAITDAQRLMEKASTLLVEAQQECVEVVTDSEEITISLAKDAHKNSESPK